MRKCQVFTLIIGFLLASTYLFANGLYQPTAVPPAQTPIERPRIVVDDIPQVICFENDKSIECNNINSRRNFKLVDDKNESHDQSEDQPTTPSNACRPSYVTAKAKCQNTQSTNPQAQTLSLIMNRARSSGNTKQACELAKQINSLSWSMNATAGIQCNSAIQKCLSACHLVSAEYENCQTLTKVVSASKNQAIENAKAYAASDICVTAASGCDSKSFDNPNCPQYCQKPGRQKDPLCTSLAQNNCSNNPSRPECVSQAAQIQNYEPVDKNRADLLKDLSLNTAENDYLSKESSAKTNQVERLTPGSVGFNKGSDGSNYIPQGAEEILQEEANRLQKENQLYAAMGVYPNNGAYGVHQRDSFEESLTQDELKQNDIDLKEFLPENFHKRNPSGQLNTYNLKNTSNRNLQSARSYKATAEDIVLDFSSPDDVHPESYMFILNRKKGLLLLALISIIVGVVWYEKSQRI